jgi:hypothetical protein
MLLVMLRWLQESTPGHSNRDSCQRGHRRDKNRAEGIKRAQT